MTSCLLSTYHKKGVIKITEHDILVATNQSILPLKFQKIPLQESVGLEKHY